MKRTPLRSYTGFNKEKQIQSAKDMRDRAQLKLREQGGINKVSEKQKIKNRVFAKKKRAHLLEFPSCEKCGRQAIDVHHARGTSGDLYTDERFFKSLCRICHGEVHNDYPTALEDGLSMSRHRRNDERLR